MSWWDLQKSINNASLRFATRSSKRRTRSDAGVPRITPAAAEALRKLLHTQERPSMRALQSQLAAICRRHRVPAPSRATLYAFLTRCPPHEYSIAELPDHVRAALYNLDPVSSVPGHQLAFSCFNHGDTRAMSFAAGLPWLDLYQASRARGWRARSRGPLLAVLRRRGIA